MKTIQYGRIKAFAFGSEMKGKKFDTTKRFKPIKPQSDDNAGTGNNPWKPCTGYILKIYFCYLKK